MHVLAIFPVGDSSPLGGHGLRTFRYLAQPKAGCAGSCLETGKPNLRSYYQAIESRGTHSPTDISKGKRGV